METNSLRDVGDGKLATCSPKVALLALLAVAVIGFAAATKLRVGRILVVGDSISQGQNLSSYQEVPWRITLDRLLRNNRIEFSFVGPWRGTCGDLPTSDTLSHMAGCGWRTIELLSAEKTTVFPFPPDVIVLASGTNDMGGVGTPGTADYKAPCTDSIAVDRMRQLIEYQSLRFPAARILVATVISRTGMTPKIAAYNSRLRALVAKLGASGIRVELLDFFSTSSEQWLHDGIHPDNELAVRMGLAAYHAIAQRPAWTP